MRAHSGKAPMETRGRGDIGCFAHRVERTHRDVRLEGADNYLILFQAAGRSALTQIDQAVQLTAGDVALVDAARPTTYSPFTEALRFAPLGLTEGHPK